MKRYSLSGETINAVINYMATQPYKEVSRLIALVDQDIKPIEDPEPEPEAEKQEEQ